MYTLTAGLVIEDKKLWDEIRPVLHDLPIGIRLERGAIDDWSSFLDQLEQLRPDVLLLDVAATKIPVEEAVERIKSTSAAIAVFALQASGDSRSIVRAHGADTAEAQLRAALTDLAAARQTQRAAASPGKTVGFLSAKGGSGATTVACHVAGELGRQTGEEVLLADYDLDAGIIGWLMNAKSEGSLLDAANHLDRLDLSYWNNLISYVNPRLEIIAAPLRRHPDEEYTLQSMREVLRFARAHYPFTIVDLGDGLSPMTRVLLREIGSIYVVTTSETPNLFQAKQLVQNLSWNGYEHDRVRLILNRAKRADFELAEQLRKVLELPVFAIPNTYLAVSAAQQKRNLVPADSILGKSFAALAKEIAQIRREEEHGGFTFLTQRIDTWLQTPGMQLGRR